MFPRKTKTRLLSCNDSAAKIARADIPASVILSPTSPPLSQAQMYAYSQTLAQNSLLSPAVGCAYTGFDYGIKCANSGGRPAYQPSLDSYTGVWQDNVPKDFEVYSPGGLPQILAGGGSGSPSCGVACSCNNDAGCSCSNSSGENCGYVGVNQTCVEPYPGGPYLSLSSCQYVYSSGRFS